MQVPKLLLILVIVLIVLAVIGLGASLFAFPDDGPENDQDEARGDLTDRLDELFPKPEPVVLLAGDARLGNGTSCLVGNALQIDSGDTCTVSVRESDALRRELLLRVTDGQVVFKVLQGESEPTQEVPFEDENGDDVNEVSVVVSRGEAATITLRCRTQAIPENCRLPVNPDD